jgi:hypothetical protein
MARTEDMLNGASTDTIGRRLALAFATSHAHDAELRPLRDMIRQAVLRPEFDRVRLSPSRLRGTYELQLSTPDSNVTFWFRTTERAAYSWRDVHSIGTSAELVRNPYLSGYQLLGYPAATRDSVPSDGDNLDARTSQTLWFSVADRPGMPGNGNQALIRAELEFRLPTTPQWLWPTLDAYLRRVSAVDSVLMARSRFAIPRDQAQAQLSMQLHVDANGNGHVDTTLISNGRRLRIRLQRHDTIGVRNPF